MALSATAQPVASWLESKHDFGVFMEQDGKVTCQMRVVNTGNEPLLIVKAQASCGCTGLTYPQDAIMPGDTATVAITYNPSGRPGQFSKQALIFTNTVPKRSVLEITGNVIPTAATLDKQYPLQAGSLRISQGEKLPASTKYRTLGRVVIQSNTLKAVSEENMASSELTGSFDAECVLPSEDQFYDDVNAIYAAVLGRNVSPTEYHFEISSRLWGTANKGWMKKSLLTAGLPTRQFASVTCDAG